MSYKTKTIIVFFLLASTLLLSYIIPETKYTGTKFISALKVPLVFSEWKGKDVTETLDINYEESTYSFINDALAHQYTNTANKTLIFIILDAGNLHNPRSCFTSAGYNIKELDDTSFQVATHNFKAHTLFTQTDKNSFLSFYWVVIDKRITHEWIEHKFKQLFFSLFNAKRIGLMVRIDVPVTADNIDDAVIMVKKFIKDLDSSMPAGKSEYILGNKSM